MLFLQGPHICKMESDKTALHVLLENTNEVLIVVHISKHALPIKIAYVYIHKVFSIKYQLFINKFI